jgi:hypothetical protein
MNCFQFFLLYYSASHRSWISYFKEHVKFHKNNYSQTNLLLQSIKKSQCPRELEPADRRTAVHVNVIKRAEDYKVSVFIPCCAFSTSLLNTI